MNIQLPNNFIAKQSLVGLGAV